MSKPIKALKEAALQAYRRGDFKTAAENQIALINTYRKTDAVTADDFALLGACLYAYGDLPQGYVAMREAHAKDPQHIGHRINLAIFANRLGRNDEALVLVEQLAVDAPHLDAPWSMLAHMYPHLGREDEARAAGLKCLEIKDKEAGRADKPKTSIPPFNPKSPERNVIAFSLWGNNPRYVEGAKRNAKFARDIYDCWTARFYVGHDTAKEIITELQRLGAQIVSMPPQTHAFEGLFWRFHAANDPDIDRFLIRDADSLVNPKERVAVDDWLQSDKHFHLMRDHWAHTEPILAGMWGGIAGVLPKISPLKQTFWDELKSRQLPDRAFDQVFLRRKIWPFVRESVLQHDTHYPFRDAKPYPPFGNRRPGIHIGQDHDVVLKMQTQGQRQPAPKFKG